MASKENPDNNINVLLSSSDPPGIRAKFCIFVNKSLSISSNLSSSPTLNVLILVPTHIAANINVAIV